MKSLLSPTARVRARHSRVAVAAALAAALAAPTVVHPQSATTDSIQLAGVAFLTAAKDVDSLFPIASAVMKRATVRERPLNSVLLGAMTAAGVPVRTDYATRTGRALAFAFDDEYQVVEKFGKIYRVATVVSGQLLSIDFRTQQAVSAMPVTLDFLYLSDVEPNASTSEKIITQVTEKFLDTTSAGVFPSAVRVYQNLIPASEGGCLVRLGDVAFDPSVVEATKGRFGTDTSRLRRVLQSQLGRTWMTASRQPLLPIGDSQARGTMQGRFANGEVFNLRIPSADYELNFTGITTKRGVAGQSAVLRVEGTGLRYRLLVTDAELKQPVTSGTFGTVQMDTLSASSPPVDGWSAISNAVKSLTGAIGAAAARDDRKWLQSNDVDKTSATSLPTWIKRRCGN
jgi:hypothetical protein